MSTTHLVYLIGAPGVGKSSVMSALTGTCWREPRVDGIPFDELWTPSQNLRDGGEPRCLAVEMGRRRTSFSGTDALAMNIHPSAAAWLSGHPYPLVLGEGDRLGCLSFLDAAHLAGVRVTLIHLTLPDEQLAERWSAARGSQNHAWRTGRRTKAANTARGWSCLLREVHHVSAADATPQQLATRLRQLVPELGALPERTVGLPLPPVLDRPWPPGGMPGGIVSAKTLRYV